MVQIQATRVDVTLEDGVDNVIVRLPDNRAVFIDGNGIVQIWLPSNLIGQTTVESLVGRRI